MRHAGKVQSHLDARKGSDQHQVIEMSEMADAGIDMVVASMAIAMGMRVTGRMRDGRRMGDLRFSSRSDGSRDALDRATSRDEGWSLAYAHRLLVVRQRCHGRRVAATWPSGVGRRATLSGRAGSSGDRAADF